MARTDPQINLRIPTELKDRVATAASESGRSTNAEIVHRLNWSLSSDLTKEMRQEVAVAGLREAAREALEYWEMKNRDASSEAGLERAMFELDHWESQLRKLDKDR